MTGDRELEMLESLFKEVDQLPDIASRERILKHLAEEVWQEKENVERRLARLALLEGRIREEQPKYPAFVAEENKRDWEAAQRMAAQLAGLILRVTPGRPSWREDSIPLLSWRDTEHMWSPKMGGKNWEVLEKITPTSRLKIELVHHPFNPKEGFGYRWDDFVKITDLSYIEKASDMNISDLDIGERAKRHAAAVGYTSIESILNAPLDTIEKQRGMGRKVRDPIRTALKKLGFTPSW